MTGYAAVAREFPFGTLSVELRSVNHRYLDLQFRLPDDLRAVEPAMREMLVEHVTRGKVDCRVSLTTSAGAHHSARIVGSRRRISIPELRFNEIEHLRPMCCLKRLRKACAVGLRLGAQ